MPALVGDMVSVGASLPACASGEEFGATGSGDAGKLGSEVGVGCGGGCEEPDAGLAKNVEFASERLGCVDE